MHPAADIDGTRRHEPAATTRLDDLVQQNKALPFESISTKCQDFIVQRRHWAQLYISKHGSIGSHGPPGTGSAPNSKLAKQTGQ
jgi:hypothetical protein